MAASQRDVSRPSLALAIAAPLATLALAYAAWAVSDRLLYLGPFDRAQVGWLVVIPLVTAAPLVAALVWRDLSDAQMLIAGSAVAIAVGAVAALLFGFAVAGSASGCQVGSRLSPFDIAFGSAVVGLVAGAGYAGSGAIGAIVMRNGHTWFGGVLSAVGGFVSLWAAALAGFGVFGFVGICSRPL
jgi:hypothetical protein